MVKKNLEEVIDKFLENYAKINDSGYNEYDLYLDMGRYRAEIKNKNKIIYYMEYKEINNSKLIDTNLVKGTKVYGLFAKLIKDYYGIKGI
jgi:hypothetical protein